MRMARAYAIGIAVSMSLVTLFALKAPSGLDFWLRETLVSASWAVAGLSTWSVAAPLSRRDEQQGVFTLAALRGFTSQQVSWARNAATALRIAAGVAVPALAVAWFGSALTANGPRWLVLRTLSVLAYSAVLGGGLSLAAFSSAAIAGKGARVLLLSCVLVPELLRLTAWPALPTLPAACGWAISYITEARGFGA